MSSNEGVLLVNETTTIGLDLDGSTSSLCPDLGYDLAVTASGTPLTGASDLTYQWFHDGIAIAASTASSMSIVNIDSLDAGEYYVTVTGECNTVQSSTNTLVVHEEVAVVAHPVGGESCETESFTFNVVATGTPNTGSVDFNFQWHYRDTLGFESTVGSDADSYQITSLVMAQAGNYWVEIDGECNTVVSDEAILTVGIQDVPQVTLSASLSEACTGDNITFIADGISLSPSITYTFFDGNGDIVSGPSVNNVAVLSASDLTQKISVRMDALATCPADGSIISTLDSVSLTVFEIPSPDVTSSDMEVCENNIILLEGQELSNVVNTTYQWYNNGTSVSNESSSIDSLPTSSAGSYFVVARHDLCGSVTSDTVDVNVISYPDVSILLNESAQEYGRIVYLVGEDRLIEAEASDGSAISWTGVGEQGDTVDFISPDELESFFEAENDGEYLMFISASNGPCVTTDSADVYLAKEVKAPNVFTPNGDGVHDTFEIQGMQYFPGAVVTIYNRWGLKVYESDSYYGNEWTGDNAPDGVYYFVILSELDDDFGYSGVVHMLR